jgi:hypothetical protein
MRKVCQNNLEESRKLREKTRVEVHNGNTLIELPVELARVIGNSQEALTDLVYRVGLTLIRTTLQEEVKSLVGERYYPDKESPWRRWSKQPGYVVWTGKKVNLKRPRVRSKDGKRGSPLESYKAFQSEKGMDERLSERVKITVSKGGDGKRDRSNIVK